MHPVVFHGYSIHITFPVIDNFCDKKYQILVFIQTDDFFVFNGIWPCSMFSLKICGFLYPKSFSLPQFSNFVSDFLRSKFYSYCFCSDSLSSSNVPWICGLLRHRSIEQIGQDTDMAVCVTVWKQCHSNLESLMLESVPVESWKPPCTCTLPPLPFTVCAISVSTNTLLM